MPREWYAVVVSVIYGAVHSLWAHGNSSVSSKLSWIICGKMPADLVALAAAAPGSPW